MHAGVRPTLTTQSTDWRLGPFGWWSLDLSHKVQSSPLHYEAGVPVIVRPTGEVIASLDFEYFPGVTRCRWCDDHLLMYNPLPGAFAVFAVRTWRCVFRGLGVRRAWPTQSTFLVSERPDRRYPIDGDLMELRRSGGVWALLPPHHPVPLSRTHPTLGIVVTPQVFGTNLEVDVHHSGGTIHHTFDVSAFVSDAAPVPGIHWTCDAKWVPGTLSVFVVSLGIVLRSHPIFLLTF